MRAKWLLAAALATAIGAAQAVEIGGINLPDSAEVGGQPLVLNGAGLRTRFFVKVYAGALYLPAKANTLEGVLAQDGPKRVLMKFIYDEVEAEKLVDAWNDGFKANSTDAELAALKDRITTFNGWFETVAKGDEIIIDLLPDGTTEVNVKGQRKGQIDGEDFQTALLKIWLGEDPADTGLKDGMLGG